ncbi:MAG: AraC family transcriptional regulator [Clostridia bacterium]|nr:AraC family transcriptional regulator [Clostridia bacterium]
MAIVEKRADDSERVKYDYNGYMAYIRKGLLSNYPNFAADSHWHDDLEFISVLSGSMDYNVNGEILHLEAGQGIIVNARQIHYGFSISHNECEFYCILLHPMLLCTSQYIEHDFVSPLLSDNSLPYILLDHHTEWQSAILSDIEAMYSCRDKNNAPLYIQNAFYHIWILLTENAVKVRRMKKQDRNLSVLKDMLSFIQKNYAGKVTLQDIAAAGNVSKSTCLVIFKKYLQDTPTNYLIGYRLKRAIKLLKHSEMPITEIALSVGFGGVSYFAETFKKNYGCSPSEYKNK